MILAGQDNGVYFVKVDKTTFRGEQPSGYKYYKDGVFLKERERTFGVKDEDFVQEEWNE